MLFHLLLAQNSQKKFIISTSSNKKNAVASPADCQPQQSARLSLFNFFHLQYSQFLEEEKN
jgi:hypothetical protein